MMRLQHVSHLALGALAGLSLVGCAAGGPPILPPVASYEGADTCADRPDLAGAVSLTPEKDKKVWAVISNIDASSPCLISEGSATPYLVYELPPMDRVKVIEIGSVLEQIRLFSPTVTVLDGEGTVTRTLSPQTYLYRTGLLSVQFTPTEAEKYVLVTANAAAMGETREALVASVGSTTIWTGYGASNWRSGNEQIFQQGFSYEGVVQALVYRPDKD